MLAGMVYPLPQLRLSPQAGEVFKQALVNALDSSSHRFLVLAQEQFGELQDSQRLIFHHLLEPKQTYVFDQVTVPASKALHHSAEVALDLLNRFFELHSQKLQLAVQLRPLLLPAHIGFTHPLRRRRRPH